MRHTLCYLSLIAIASQSYAGQHQETTQFIIKFKQQPQNQLALRAELASYLQEPIADVKPMAAGAYVLVVQGADKKKSRLWLNRLSQDKNLQYAVPDRIGHFKPTPEPQEPLLSNVLSHTSQWDEFKRPGGMMLESEDGLKDGAWAYTTGQSNPPIVVAVLDTGIALNPAIVNSLVKDETGAVVGWNFYGNNNNLSDETRSYHGTHVAGTIAGYGDVMNGMGEHLRILVEKIPNKSGMFYESAVINAIYWAVGEQVPGLPNNPYPAKVLNMSFGVDIGPGNEMEYCDQPLQDAVDFARNQGAVLAVAAGNENHWENFSAPAVCNGTLRIASTGPTGLRSYFSNYGPSATFAAPGGDKRYGMTGEILSTVNPGGGYQGSGYDFFQGTSMATPHAAGLAGLLFAVSGGELKGDSIEQLMYATTHDFGLTTDSNHSCVGDKPCGHGILDAENAVKAALMHFEQVFTAPSFSQLATVSCGKGKVKPLPKTLDIASNKWLPISNECQAIENYLHPRLVSVKKGIIHAVYGNVEYKLITEGGKTCQIIGYDGLGC